MSVCVCQVQLRVCRPAFLTRRARGRCSMRISKLYTSVLSSTFILSTAMATTPFQAWNTLDAWEQSHNEPGCQWKTVNYHRASYKHCIRNYTDTVSSAIRTQGVWPDCLRLITLWKKLASLPSTNFIDAGANIGACTMLMGSQFDINVTAFEPNPENLFYLTKSLLANPDINRKVLLYPFGLGAHAATFPMFVQRGNAGNSVLRVNVAASTKKSYDIQVFPLDAAFIFDTRTIRLMKMDVQGFESLVLTGSHHLLSQQRIACITFEVATAWIQGQNTTSGALYDIFVKYGYLVLNSHLTQVSKKRFTKFNGISDYTACTPSAFALLS